MAGIGFELRKLLQKETLVSMIRAYVYAGVISSGPWVLSIVGMVLIGFFSFSVVSPNLLITHPSKVEVSRGGEMRAAM